MDVDSKPSPEGATSPPRRSMPAWALPALVGTTCLCITAWAAWLVRSSAEETFRARLTAEAQGESLELERGLEAIVAELEVLGDLLQDDPHMPRAEYRRLTRGIIRRHHDILTVEWIPRVPRPRREAHVARAQADGLHGYTITERTDAGALAPAGLRDEYFPVFYVEPLAGNERAVGYDLGSNPARRSALEQAMRSGRPTATEPIRLVQEDEDQAAVLIFVPVYGSQTNGGAIPQAVDPALLGFSLGVLRVDDFVESVVHAFHDDEAWLSITDTTSGGSAPLYGEASTVAHTTSTPIDFAGRTWVFSHAPTPSQLQAWSPWGHRLVLAVGTLLSLVLAVLIGRIAGDSRRATGLVERRTAELRASVERATMLGAAATRTRDALTRTQARFERAVDGANDGLWDYEPATGRVWYSDRFKSLVGYEPWEYDQFRDVIESWSDLLHPSDKPRVLDTLDRHMGGEAPYDVTYRLRMRNGEHRWFRARGQSLRDELGTVVRVSGAITDIDDQRSTEERLSLAMKASRIGLWDWDIPSGEMFFSDTFYTMLGYEPGELPMCVETWKALRHPEDLDDAVEEIRRHTAGATALYRHEHRLRRKDGSWLWVRDVGEVIERDERGTATRMLGVHIDIDESKRIEASVLAAKEAAESANVAKSEFLANMSHEIRTPMTAILGYADLLDGDDDPLADPVRAAESIRAIRANANHLLTIINDILDMSKIEAGKMTVERLPTSPALLAAEAASLFQVRATGKGIEVRVEYDTPVPEQITSDRTRLRQILLNLVGNAVKFTEVGHVVIHVSCDPDEGVLRYAVSDTGIGMTPEQRDEIARFDAFSQADGSMARKFGGTGLGLRISSSLARMLGGGIAIESEPGRGSTFTATVSAGDLSDVEMLTPEAAADLGPAGAVLGASPVAGIDLDGLRILLAEDGPDNQRLISFYLRKAGAAVTIAGNGRIACERLAEAERPFDLVLMDMQMPELDGYAAARTLRHDGHALPIVALTALAMDGDEQKCLAAGCDDYLTKPVDRGRLLATCARWGRASCRDAA
jgi:PAS domain S-box-containing protein